MPSRFSHTVVGVALEYLAVGVILFKNLLLLLNYILYILNLFLIGSCSWKLPLGLVVVDIDIVKPFGGRTVPASISLRKLRWCH